jgi:hypothetical protein
LALIWKGQNVDLVNLSFAPLRCTVPTYYDPPALLSLGGEEWSDDRAGHLVLSLQLHLHVHRLTGGEAVLILHLVLQLNIWVPAHPLY